MVVNEEEAFENLHSLLLGGNILMHRIIKEFDEMFGYKFLEKVKFGKLEDALRSRNHMFRLQGSFWKSVASAETVALQEEINKSQRGTSRGGGGRGGSEGRGFRGGGGGGPLPRRGNGTQYAAAFGRGTAPKSNISISQRTTFPKTSTYAGSTSSADNDFQTTGAPRYVTSYNDYNEPEPGSVYGISPEPRVENIYSRPTENPYNKTTVHPEYFSTRGQERGNDGYTDQYDNRYRQKDNYDAPRGYNDYNNCYDEYKERPSNYRKYSEEDRYVDERNNHYIDDERNSYSNGFRANEYLERDVYPERGRDEYRSSDTNYYPPGPSTDTYRNEPPPQDRDRRNYYPPRSISPSSDFSQRQQPPPPPGLEKRHVESHRMGNIRSDPPSRASNDSQNTQITPSKIISLMIDLFKSEPNPIPLYKLNEIFQRAHPLISKSIAQYDSANTPELFLKKFIRKAEGRLQIDGEFLYLSRDLPVANNCQGWWKFYLELYDFIRHSGPMTMSALRPNIINDEEQWNQFKLSFVKVFMDDKMLTKGLSRSFAFLPLQRNPPPEISILNEHPDSERSIYEETLNYMSALLPDRLPLRFMRSPDRTPVDPAPSNGRPQSVRSGTSSFHSAAEIDSPLLEKMLQNERPASTLPRFDDLPPIQAHDFKHELEQRDESKFGEYEGQRIRFLTSLVDLRQFWIVFEKDMDAYVGVLDDVKRAWREPPPSNNTLWDQGDAAIFRLHDVYYRVKLLEKPTKQMVRVELVDMGGQKIASLRDLSPLPPDLFIQPAIALRCAVVPFNIIDQPKYDQLMNELSYEISRRPDYSLVLSRIQMFAADDGRFIVDITMDGNRDLREKFFVNKAIKRFNLDLRLNYE